MGDTHTVEPLSAPVLTDAERQRHLVRAVAASAIGTVFGRIAGKAAARAAL
ncbi:MAG TPA: hypothetical protein VIK60_04810 [Vicinamibacterales bacterium]